MAETSSSEVISTRLQQVAELARNSPQMVFTTLAHHIDVQWLYEAYQRTRKDGAVGVDGQTQEEYAPNLSVLAANLKSLRDRLKSGTYRAPAVRRVYIPKGDGKKRPIGIPTFEDKILQRAVTMVLEAVYEQEFKECSYGYRPGRSAHQALEILRTQLMEMHGGTVVEVDIQAFFDSLDHGHLRAILNQRVRDGVLRRMIDKWLKAGVLEDGEWSSPENGTPQGGVISPLLANIYLHEVLDRWFEQEVQPRLEGKAVLVRYADDFVIVFTSARDAERVMAVLPKRFGKYGLNLHPEKTRMVNFQRPQWREPMRPQVSFDLLGFTHYWGRSRTGNWVVRQQTMKQRFDRAVKVVVQWCRRYRHLPIREQQKGLVWKLKGHYAYYGITGNVKALQRFHYEVRRSWRRWLNRRSQRRSMPWDRFARLLVRYPLPAPVVVRSVFRHAARP